MSADLRALPAVEALLQTQQAANLVAEYGRPLTLEAIRAELADLRRRLKENGELTIPERGQILDAASDRLESWLRSTLHSGDQRHRGGAAHQPGAGAAEPGSHERGAEPGDGLLHAGI